ncbi:MAG: hypothetical protein C7B44_10495 [Sulfobacillus thermosulfidooxidans]|nr:MAG: hypothetical protein C7B44_10495 [Sulfobacillus thermosulfidooxidans]
MMTTRSKLFWGAGLILLTGLLLWISSTASTTIPSKPISPANFAADTRTPWTLRWVSQGIAPKLRNHHGWTPWIVANPQRPQQSWWVWPVVEHHRLWFGQSVPGGVQWVGVSLTAKAPKLPIPWATMLGWGQQFQHQQSPPADVTITPTSAWTQEGPLAGPIAGFMMAMQPRKNTIVLAILYKKKIPGWIELVSIWQWNTQWTPRYLIINPLPSQVSAHDLLMPPNAGVPLDIPTWVKNTS